MNKGSNLSRRAYQSLDPAYSWEEIMEAGPYYERISALLEDAQHYAIFVGWQIDSRLPLRRPPQFTIESLKHKILRLVEEKPDFHFYFLMWDHAYFYILERETWQGRVWDEIHPRVHFIFDNRHAFGGSHHEKVCIIDGKIALCGGIDLCDERWDSPQHLFYDRRRSLEWKNERHGPYHDVAVQVTGPVCAQIQEHVRSRWEAISSIPFPPCPETPKFPQPARNAHGVYISRTLVDVDAGSIKPVTREIEFLFRDLIGLAERRIILEGQYYWSKEINDLLIAKMHAMQKKGAHFEIVLILADIQQLRALTQQMSFYELKLLEKLDQAAKESGCKLTLGSPYVFPTVEDTVFDREARPKPVYIHSKVIIVDDRFISIGSANLATRALRLDTEINLTLEAKSEFERHHIRRFSENLLAHWNIGRPHLHDHDDVKFVPLRPTHEIKRRMDRLNPLRRLLQTLIPWKVLFDPSQPWLHPVARKARKIARNHPGWEKWLIILLWAGTAALTIALASVFHPFHSGPWGSPWMWGYAAVLSSVWFAPVPFVALSILSGFHLGMEAGIELSIFAFWISALTGYCLTRLFPTYSTRFFRETAPRWLPARLRLRRFPVTVSVTADFRISLRSKIAYQGLYCIPFAWFLLNMMLVLPAALYMLLRVVFAIARPALSNKIHFYAPAIFTILLTYALARLVVSYFSVKSAATKKGLSRRAFP